MPAAREQAAYPPSLAAEDRVKEAELLAPVGHDGVARLPHVERGIGDMPLLRDLAGRVLVVQTMDEFLPVSLVRVHELGETRQ